MKAIRVALLTGTLLIGSAFPALAGAAPAQPNPSQLCAMMEDFGVSRGACASTVATGGLESGVLTKAAYVSQCQNIRAEAIEGGPGSFAYEAYYGDVSLNPVQYGFGGKISSCAVILEKYHTGQYGGH